MTGSLKESLARTPPPPRPARPLWPVVLVFNLPVLGCYWFLHWISGLPREDAGAAGMGIIIVAPIAALSGFIALVLTATEWLRYFARHKKDPAVSAIPAILVSLINVPFFWLCLSALTLM